MHGAHIFADKGPQAYNARDQEHPDNELLDGRVQSRFLILPACSARLQRRVGAAIDLAGRRLCAGTCFYFRRSYGL
jgi:hypothetical protein